ncbi:MAG: hypothetical protein NCW75_06485 [Phycisphaera sp.]|nr:MAG: hypothetical protein NCW75_06485 [Phycisphaera sp.]
MKRLLQAMVTDERGRDVPVVRELRSLPGPIAVWRKRTSTPPRVAGIYQCLWIGTVYILVKGSLYTGFLAYATISTIGISVGEAVEQMLFIPLSMLGMVAVLVLTMRCVWAFWGRSVSARLMASRGRCPSCGSSLVAGGSDDGGVTTCESCSAAWHVGAPEACPGCGYDLGGLPGATGGNMTCPECSATWPTATAARVQTERLIFHGAMRDDAGSLVARQSKAKIRRAVVRSRAKGEQERARLPGIFLWLATVAAVFLVIPVIGMSTTWLAGLVLPERGSEFAGGVMVLAGAALCVAIMLRYKAWAQRYECRRLAICPACDADMRGLVPNANGLTPCPNCDAEWKLPPQSTD